MYNSIRQNIIIYVSTCFKIGFLPKAPGTFGSLAATPFLPIIIFNNNALSITFLIITFILGMWAAGKYAIENDDPSEVVIDEFAGLLLTFYIIQFFTQITLFIIIISFVIFRIFDILKPWPICLFDEKIKGGFGIMFDDIAAAVMAGLSLGIAMKLIV